MRNHLTSNFRLIKFILLLSLGAISIYLVYIKLATPVPLISPVAGLQSSLKDVVESALIGAKGTYGIAIKNLATGETFFVNEHKVFEAGSLYKLWIMAAVYKQIQDGKLTADQVLSKDVVTLNKKFNLGPDFAELTDGTITLTVGAALDQMITISHNYAALLLTQKIRLSSVAAFLKSNGFNASTVGTDGGFPTATPSDIALFFEKLYKGELASQENTQKMIDTLKEQTLNSKLPKYLPKEVAVAHKTGEIGYLTHDAGIIFSDTGDYIIVVMSDSDFPPAAADRISDISKNVYEYFQKI